LGGCCEIFLKIILRKNYHAEARNQHKTIVVNKQQLCGRESFATSSQQQNPKDTPLLSLSAKNNQERLEHKTFTKNPDFSHSVRK